MSVLLTIVFAVFAVFALFVVWAVAVELIRRRRMPKMLHDSSGRLYYKDARGTIRRRWVIDGKVYVAKPGRGRQARKRGDE